MSEFTIRTAADQVTIVLPERLDTANAPSLLDELKKFAGQPIQKVLFDCTRLAYVSSAGLRVMIFAKQKIATRGEVALVGAVASVKSVVAMSGFDSFLIMRDR
jgi:anti-anti-sigma factor